MLGGKNKHRPQGYTIVEVMVVLAVSGMMFLLAANFINGRQARTAFTEGVNTMASNLQDLIAQVQAGKYSDADLNCLFDGSSISFPNAESTQTQGTNSACVFLGKIMYFSYDTSNPDSSYEIFTLAGGRVDSNGNAFTSPNAAFATVVTNPDLTARTVTPQNLTVSYVKAYDSGGVAHNTYGLGFFQNPALDVGGQVASGGVETINLYYLSPKLSAANNNETNARAEINPGGGGTLNTAKSADICLTDGARHADVLVGAPSFISSGGGNSLVVNVKMDDTKPCSG
ncbi:MAG TPA: prepilin-type N-terminal cleavage/methylation domain-containing protein [Candidatus Saccharimonadales bacterium]|nr:prepilin-type N-terminal cleavage/methylation domain-containing protein [Candidatus Saccharimonadales bacterium]